MSINVPRASAAMNLPEPFSDRPPLIWFTNGAAVNPFALGQSILVKNPKTETPQQTPFRVVNCAIISNVVTDCYFDYKDANNNAARFYPRYSGVHAVIGFGIVAIGVGIEPITFQVGI